VPNGFEQNYMELLRAMKRLSLPFLVLSIFVMTQACTTTMQANTGDAVISSVSPSQVVAGSTGFTLSVYGSGFVGNAVVLWNGSARATRVVSKTQLQASISSTDIQQAGSAAVTVDDQRGNSAASNSVFVTIQPAASGISISPATAVVPAGNTQQFSATVTGTTNSLVSWKVNGTLGGNSTVGTISGSGLYKAPNVSSNSSVMVTAADGTSQANASVTIVPAATPVSVSISPTSANVQVGRSQQFTATVSGTTNTAVNWLVGGILGGNSSVGTISSTGLYTAPSSVPANPVTVTAQSAFASTSSSNAIVTILPAPTPVSVSISPTSANVQVGQSQQFTATVSGTTNTAVTWLVSGILGGNSSVGTISSTGLYTAPSSVPTNPVTVTAQSVYASTSSSNATVTILPAPTASGGIASAFFGMHTMDPFSSYPAWPSVPVGAFGKGTRTLWSYIETSQGVYDWSRLDAYVALSEGHGVKMMYAAEAIPEWAAADKSTCSVPFAGAPARCSGMVSNIQYWDDFVTALVTRYKGKITAYELWNEPNNYFTGTVADMVTLTQHFHDKVRAIDPAAIIISPSYTVSTDLDTYFAAGGTLDVEAVSFHAYPDSRGDAELITRSWVSSQRAVMVKYGLASKPLWNTEGGWGSGVSDPNLQAAFIARYFILSWSRGVARTYWYAWDNQQLGTLYTTSGTNPTLAAIAYQQVYNWMVGAVITGPYNGQCSSSGGYSGNGALAPYNFDYNYTASFYTCNFTSDTGSQKQVVWQTSSDSTLTTVYTVPSAFSKYLDLKGNTITVPGSRQVTVTNSPIMFVP
jgi:Cellulase (glycosyl hydrolase family 5)